MNHLSVAGRWGIGMAPSWLWCLPFWSTTVLKEGNCELVMGDCSNFIREAKAEEFLK